MTKECYLAVVTVFLEVALWADLWDGVKADAMAFCSVVVKADCLAYNLAVSMVAWLAVRKVGVLGLSMAERTVAYLVS